MTNIEDKAFHFSQASIYNPTTGETIPLGEASFVRMTEDHVPVFHFNWVEPPVFTLYANELDSEIFEVVTGSRVHRWKQTLLRWIESLPALWRRK